MSEPLDPDIAPGYIIDPAIPDDAPLTVGEARRLHHVMGVLATTVGTFNDRLAGGERRWAVLSALSIAIVLVLGGVIWLGLGVDRIAHCQAQQTAAITASSTQIRTSRANQDDQSVALLDSQITLFNTVLNPASTQQERLNASISYQQSVRASRVAILAAKQKTADNPLPPGSCT